MSIKVMAAVWEESTQQGSALILMLALADHANDDGVSWPSIERLAQRARITDRQTQKILQHLIASGELYVLHNAGRSYANLYLVTIGHTTKTLAKVLEQRFSLPADEARQLSYGIVARRPAEKVSCSSPFRAEKVNSSAEKVNSSAEKVNSSAQKGELQDTLTVINRQLTPIEPEEETTADEATLRAAETWDRARNLLRMELPQQTYNDRLRDTVGVSQDDTIFRVECLTQTQVDFLTRRLQTRVVEALAAVIGRPVDVEFTTRQAPRLLQ